MGESLCIHVRFGDQASCLALWVLWQVSDMVAHGCSQACQAHQLKTAAESSLLLDYVLRKSHTMICVNLQHLLQVGSADVLV